MQSLGAFRKSTGTCTDRAKCRSPSLQAPPAGADARYVTRVRWPFLLVLIAALVGAGVVLFAQTLVPRMQEEDPARADAQARAEDAAYNARMKAVSDRVVRPASLPRDCPEWTDKSLGHFCWQGDGDPLDAAVAVRDSVAKIASAPPSIRCWENSVGQICEVKAKIDGKFLNSLALPPKSGAPGVRLDGVVLEVPVGDVPVAGTPLAVPE